jgi:4-amino-4-deoxy-L-arabinose transferase-like glycosyltransferase
MINAIKKNLFFLALILLLILFIILKIPYLGLPYYWDEAWVYGPALRFMEAHQLSLMPDALPVSYSRGHPLLFHFLGALWLRIFGVSLLSSHLFALFVSIALLIIVYYFCRSFFSQKVGLLACFLILVQPIFQAQSVLVLPEILLSLFLLMTIFFFLKEKWIGYILAGTCALLTKETAIVIVISALFWFLLNSFFIKKEKIKAINFISKSVILVIPIIFFCFFLILQKRINGWYFFPDHLQSISTDLFIIIKNLIKRTIYLLTDDGRIMLFLAMLISIYFFFSKKTYRKNPANITLIFLVIFSAFYLFICAVNFYSNRYSISIIIPFIIMASFFIINFFTKKTYLFLFILGILCLQLFVFIPKEKSSDCSLGYTQDIKTSKQMVEYCVDNNFQNKSIFANFLMTVNLSNPYSGYITEQHRFPNTSSKIDNNTELYIFSSMELLKENKEQIDAYNKIKSSKTIRLLKRFESKFSWTEIYGPTKQ